MVGCTWIFFGVCVIRVDPCSSVANKVCLRFAEEEEAGHQDGEGDQGEDDASVVMQSTRQETRVHVSAEEPEDHDPHRVGKCGYGNGQDAEADLLREGSQEHVPQ